MAERAGLPFGVVTRALSHPSTALHSLDRPVTDYTIIDAVALAAWLAWAWLAICLCVEVVARFRGRPPARLPASRHAQAFAALLIGASVAVLPLARSHPPIRIAGTQASQSAKQNAVLVDEVRPLSSITKNDTACPSELGTTRSLASNPPQSGFVGSENTSQRSHRNYIVRAGDTLWSIASQQLRSPLRWREIADLNAGKAQPDGETLVDAGWILPGWVLVLPQVPAHGQEVDVGSSADLATAPIPGTSGANKPETKGSVGALSLGSHDVGPIPLPQKRSLSHQHLSTSLT